MSIAHSESTLPAGEPPRDASILRPFDPSQPYRLHPRVALRPEPFGAMAYHYDNRRLNFLRHPDLVRVVEHLSEYPSVDATLEAEAIAAGRRPSFVKALGTLAASNFLVPA